MRVPTRFVGLAMAIAAMTAASVLPAAAKCQRMGFLVNDYGKDGPTKDAQELLDKHVAKWASENNITDYRIGKKDVQCELFLNFIVFDEHTCTASADVCWGDDKPAATKAKTATEQSTPAKKKVSEDKPKETKAKTAAKEDKPAAYKVETGAIPDAAAAAPVAAPAAAAADPDAAEKAAAAAERAAAAAERAAQAAERAAAASEKAVVPAAVETLAPASAPAVEAPAAVAPVIPAMPKN